MAGEKRYERRESELWGGGVTKGKGRKVNKRRKGNKRKLKKTDSGQREE